MALPRWIFLGIALLGACTPSEPKDPVAPQVEADAELVFVGRLTAHDGSPLKAAHLTLTRSNFRTQLADLELPVDGRFRVELPGRGCTGCTSRGSTMPNSA